MKRILAATFVMALGLPAMAQSIHGIPTRGFHASQRQVVQQAMDTLKSFSPDLVVTRHLNLVRPYSHVKHYVREMRYDGNYNAYGYTRNKRVIWLTGLLFSHHGRRPANIAATILHEADHHRYGPHSASSTADIYDNGPFGIAAYYLLKYFHQPGRKTNERWQAASLALARKTYNITSQIAKQRIQVAYEKNKFPQLTGNDPRTLSPSANANLRPENRR